MIAFQDFVPKQLRRQGFIKPPVYETFQDAVTAAGVWLREQEITVISIETVVLPALWNKRGSQNDAAAITLLVYDTGYATRAEVFQFVRVWYQSE